MMNDVACLIVLLSISVFVAIMLRSRRMNKVHPSYNKSPHSNAPFGSRQNVKQAGIDSRKKSEEDILYGKLLSMVLSDKGVAERLIEYEKRKLPTASRIELIQRAIDHKISDGMR